MSTNFFLKSITFSNYRGLKDLHIPAFRRINLIGGFNGVGKSTLLEGIFFLFDRRAPISLIRPYAWRQVGMAGKSVLEQYFSDQNNKEEISISAKTSAGNLVTKMTFGPIPTGVSVNVPTEGKQGSGDLQQSLGSITGLNVETSIDGIKDDAFFALPTLEGVSVNSYRLGTSNIPPAIILTPQTRNSPLENATRFSTIYKERRQLELLQILSSVNPEIKTLQLLQEGNTSTLYAEFHDGTLYPFPMLGDGLQTLLAITLAIMTSTGGAVLLDEFDSAIHYSILTDVWAKIANLANKYNCQIFAVTHSLECIKSALKGVQSGSRLEDFFYLRLERRDHKISSTPYDGKELKDSLSAEWEIR